MLLYETITHQENILFFLCVNDITIKLLNLNKDKLK